MNKQIDPGEGYVLLRVGQERRPTDEVLEPQVGVWGPMRPGCDAVQQESSWPCRRKKESTRCGCDRHNVPHGADPYKEHRRWLAAQGVIELGSTAAFGPAYVEAMRAKTENTIAVDIQHEDFV